MFRLKTFGVVSVLVVLSLAGCRRKEAVKDSSIELLPPEELGQTVGMVAQVPSPEPVPVQGYGIVGGLAGTGSSHCPVPVREYLTRYVQTELAGLHINVEQLIQSRNTAIVRLDGVVPPAASKSERFDVRVSLITGSDATSLHGGWLYQAELYPEGLVGMQGRLAGTVEGAVFVNLLGGGTPDLVTGYALGGGRAAYEYRGLVRLRRAHFPVASQLRNRLNERYGSGTATALSPSDIELRIPSRYRWRKERFIELVRATFLDQTSELIQARINTFVHRLAVGEEKASAEIALEVIGRASLPKLATLLRSSDKEVGLRAARCMLSLGDDRGLVALRNMVMDKDSPYRREALDAAAVLARRGDAGLLVQRLLQDDDVRLVQAAYEHLRRMDNPAVTQELVGRSFYLEQVTQASHKAVYVSRRGQPRVVIFGGPLICRDNLFVESPGGGVLINSPAGQDYVAITRSHPSQPEVIGPLRASFELCDIVRTLGAEPAGAQPQPGMSAGLGVCYGEVAALLQQVVAKDVVDAEFWAGPLPKISPIVKK
ncbi:MAG: flagellar basal body P-ring protein FlgI [Sedimentisphaerales bacterium]|nr:flagellar basal body P-ring protein FlgI [Sedimentisphaerales bacterium]